MIAMHYWIAKHRLPQSGSSLNVGLVPTDDATHGLIVERRAVVHRRNDRGVVAAQQSVT
jgi:hypothetical protein